MRIRFLLFFAALAVGLSGCLQVRTLLSVFPDGTGRIVTTLQIRPEAYDRLKALAELAPDTKGGDNKDGFVLIDEEELRAAAKAYGPGVTYEGVKPLDDAGGPGYVATYRVADVRTLTLPPIPSLPMSDPSTATDEVVTFDFEAATDEAPARLTIQMPPLLPDSTEIADVGTPATDESADLAELEEARALFDGMLFSLRVRPEGTVLDTDAAFVDEGTLTLLRLDFTEAMADAATLRAFMRDGRPSSPDDLAARLAEVPGMDLETQPAVTVTFEGER